MHSSLVTLCRDVEKFLKEISSTESATIFRPSDRAQAYNNKIKEFTKKKNPNHYNAQWIIYLKRKQGLHSFTCAPPYRGSIRILPHNHQHFKYACEMKYG